MTKQTERPFTVYAEMCERGVPCNTVTYNTLLDACARCGCMGRAPKLVADMRAAGIVPDTITYSTLVKGHCFSGDIDEAFAVLKEMRDTDGLVPDEVLYNSLLDGCAKEHRLQEALDLFATMRAEGVRPSNFTLCTLVKLLGRARRLPARREDVQRSGARMPPSGEHDEGGGSRALRLPVVRAWIHSTAVCRRRRHEGPRGAGGAVEPGRPRGWRGGTQPRGRPQAVVRRHLARQHLRPGGAARSTRGALSSLFVNTVAAGLTRGARAVISRGERG